MRLSVNSDALIKSILLFGLILFLFLLNSSGELSLYIHPRFIGLSKAAGCLLALLMLVQCLQIFSPGAHPPSCNCGHHHKSSWSYIPFAFAIFIAFAFPSTSLDASMVANKGLNSRLGASSLPFQDAQPLVQPTIKELAKLHHIHLTDANFVDVISELVANPDTYIGKEITLTGFVFKDPAFTSSQIALVRYEIICCSADAAPFGMICEFDKANQYPADTWLTISGTIQMGQHVNMKLPIIKAASVHAGAKPPKSPYVYPQ